MSKPTKMAGTFGTRSRCAILIANTFWKEKHSIYSTVNNHYIWNPNTIKTHNKKLLFRNENNASRYHILYLLIHLGMKLQELQLTLTMSNVKTIQGIHGNKQKSNCSFIREHVFQKSTQKLLTYSIFLRVLT